MVGINEPPPRRTPRKPLHVTISAGSELYRIYDPGPPYYSEATTFRFGGPQRRFDHRLIDETSPTRGVYYAARDLEGAIVEVFGDTGVVQLLPWYVAVSYPQRDLLLLDLRGSGAMRAGTNSAVTKARHNQTYQWSRYFYEHPEIYGELDGLLWPNAHNDADAILLYERTKEALMCPGGPYDRPLADPQIVTELEIIAEGLDLAIEMNSSEHL